MLVMNTGTVKVTTPSDREVVVTRSFDAPRRLVFEAWTKPEYIQRWMLGPEGWTMPVCKIDLRVGGEWHFVWRRGSGTEMSMRGTYKEIKPPERLVSTESWGPEWPETLNTVFFFKQKTAYEMTLTILYVSKEARDNA